LRQLAPIAGGAPDEDAAQTFYRYEPDAGNVESIASSGELYGSAGQYGGEPAVRALHNLPPNVDPANYIRFETTAQPGMADGQIAYFRAGDPGVQQVGDRVMICVTNVTRCGG
jgi:hypothetical protein